MIPRAPLLLGLAGLIPFVLAASAAMLGDTIVARAFGAQILLQYGTVILAFMSGVLWGFATRAAGRMATIGYALSVLPALWAFFFTLAGGPLRMIALAAGFAALLGLDWYFARAGLTPPWWMRLRALLTSVVLVCLAFGYLRLTNPGLGV